MKRKYITSTQLEFIFESKKNGMRQIDIAAKIGVTPAAVCKVLKPRKKVVVMDGYFDIDREYKRYYNY